MSGSFFAGVVATITAFLIFMLGFALGDTARKRDFYKYCAQGSVDERCLTAMK